MMKKWDSNLQEVLGPAGLCNFIETECQPDINASFEKITGYFSVENNKEIPEPVFELAQLLYAKLDDEVQHLFRKESGLIFPAIKKASSGSPIEQKIPDSIQTTQKVIINLLQKLRQITNNYVIQPNWSKEWKSCVNELFVLESKIHQWIYIEQSMLYPTITPKNDMVQ